MTILCVTLFGVALTTFGEAPITRIISPKDGSVFAKDKDITFTGRGYSAQFGPSMSEHLQWSSDKEGKIGAGNTFTVRLSVGTHVITLVATDKEGGTGAAQITITVQ